MDNSKMNTNPNYTPITCPKCGCSEIAFVTEYHKCLAARIIFSLIAILLPAFCCAIFFTEGSIFAIARDGISTMIIIFSVIGLLVTKLLIIIIESKTHVQAICRNCGKLWLLH